MKFEAFIVSREPQWILLLQWIPYFIFDTMIFFPRNRFTRGWLYYYFRRAWRRVPQKTYRLFARVSRKWRRITIRGRKPMIRVGRRYRKIRITPTKLFILRGRRWVNIRRRRRVRLRRKPWRRGRRYRRRRYGVMRVYVGRRWRQVYQTRGRFFFRYRRRSCSLRYD